MVLPRGGSHGGASRQEGSSQAGLRELPTRPSGLVWLGCVVVAIACGFVAALCLLRRTSRSEAGQDLSNFGCLHSRLLHLDVRSLGGKSLKRTQEGSSLLTYRGALAFFSYQR
jgi:hypothetical protein